MVAGTTHPKPHRAADQVKRRQRMATARNLRANLGSAGLAARDGRALILLVKGKSLGVGGGVAYYWEGSLLVHRGNRGMSISKPAIL